MTLWLVQTENHYWNGIAAVLGPDDFAVLGIRRDGSQTVDDWIRILAETAAKHLDSEPCDRDHCPTNCEPCTRNHYDNGVPNAKA